MGSTTSDDQTKPIFLYDFSPSQPLPSKPSNPSLIQDDPSHNHSDPYEPDSNQYGQISFNYGPSALSRNVRLFGVLPCMTIGLVVYYAPIVVFMMFSKYNGKIVPKKSNGEYTCVLEAGRLGACIFCAGNSHHVVVCSGYGRSPGLCDQWDNCSGIPLRKGRLLRRALEDSLKNAFGPSSGTVCLSLTWLQ